MCTRYAAAIMWSTFEDYKTSHFVDMFNKNWQFGSIRVDVNESFRQHQLSNCGNLNKTREFSCLCDVSFTNCLISFTENINNHPLKNATCRIIKI